MKKHIIDKKLRPLTSPLVDQYTRDEVLSTLKTALFAPAATMDVPLIKEALSTLHPSLSLVPVPGKHFVWRGIEEKIKGTSTIPRFKKLILILFIILLLATTAFAIINHYHSLTALTYENPAHILPINEDTLGYVRQNLAESTFENSHIAVEEALFDGQQLRIVYAVTDTRAQPQTFAPDVLWADGMEVEKLDNLTGILGHGTIIVNGEDVYLEDTVDFTGDIPNQRKYYMGVTLPKHLREGETLTVELPIHSRYHNSDINNPKPDLTIDPIAHSLTFTLSTQTESSHLNRKGKPVTAFIEGYEHHIDTALFSAVDGYIELIYDAPPPDDNWGWGIHWSQADLLDTKGNIIAISRAQSWDDTRMELHFIPMGPWPDEMVLNGKNEEGDYSDVFKLTIVLE